VARHPTIVVRRAKARDAEAIATTFAQPLARRGLSAYTDNIAAVTLYRAARPEPLWRAETMASAGGKSEARAAKAGRRTQKRVDGK